MAYGEIARGLGDLKIYVLGAADAPGAGIDWPGVRTLGWQANQDSEDWEGDDTVIASAQDAKTGSGSLAVGRQSPTALAAVLGSTAVVTGTGSLMITVVEETGAATDVYVRIAGQARSLDTGGSAYQVDIHKAKIASPAEELGQKSYNEPSMDITFLPNQAGKFVTRTWMTTATAIPTTIA